MSASTHQGASEFSRAMDTPSPLTAAALKLAADGWPVFPCKANKKPLTENGFKNASTNRETIETAFENPRAKLIGVPTGAASGFDVVDLDPRHGSDPWRVEHIGQLPDTRVHRTPGKDKDGIAPDMPGEHWLFRHFTGVVNDQNGNIADGVDVRGEGGYIIAAGPGYSVINDNEIAPWPIWLLEKALKLKQESKAARPAIEPRQKTEQLEKRYRAYVDTLLANVRHAGEGQKHGTLLANARALGGILAAAGISEADALAWLIDALPASVRDWNAAKKTASDGLKHGQAAPFDLEDRPGYGNKSSEPPPAGQAKARTSQKPSSASPLDGFDLTEDGIALAFTAEHQDLLRFDHTRGAWFQWTGKAWRQDETKLAFSWSRRICRRLAKQADAEGKVLAIMAKAATAASVERFAQSDPALAVTSAIWDRDPFLLGTPGGTVDLRTGELREPASDDHITKLTAVAPAVMPECPMWLAFLEQATNGDNGLIRFLRQWCGYCLTGDTREHALLFGYGSGGNGKGVFLNTVSRIMGEYARNAAMDTFTASSTDKHPTDLAMLRGARLVTASETEEGRAWAEARIKALTGGDTITARFMRQDFFEYVPHFKLTIIGNHKPVLKNVDDAAKRRFNVVPFVHRPARPDLQLEHKLKAEWPAILRWMIEGCLDWQMHGLVRPEVVKNTTAEYFSEQDTVNQWVTEFCTLGATQSDTLETLFKSWTAYAMANGEKPGTSKWFSQTLSRLGCTAVKDTPMNHGKRGFKGIAVTPVVKPSHNEPSADRE